MAMMSKNFVMAEHRAGRFQIMRAYWARLQRSPLEVQALERAAAADNAPYDALWKKEDGSWATLRQDVLNNAMGRTLRTDIDGRIAYEAQKVAEGIPF
jgi:hypothetical protein